MPDRSDESLTLGRDSSCGNEAERTEREGLIQEIIKRET
jgi:hypothetical protein